MDTFLEIIKMPFVWGLLLGLLFAFFAWKSGFAKASNLKKENKRIQDEMKDLQNHLNTQLKINSTGNQALQDELEDLKKNNENLRSNIAVLQQKPEKAELRQLHITEGAVRMMREQAPGFASAWEKTLRDSEVEYEEAESGLKKLVRKILPQSSSKEKSLKVIEVKESPED